LIEESVPPAEQPVRVVLTGLALLSLGDLGAVAQFDRALQMEAPAGPVQFLLGAARAMQNRDREAIAAWEAARSAGVDPPLLDRLIAEAYLRQRDFASAAKAISPERTVDAAASRTFAATRIASRQFDDALSALDALLAQSPDDADSRWLLLHALYADFVGGNKGRAERVAAEASRYIEAKGPHAALAAEWLSVVRQ
jgi:tetratricopeptide (TPR) repeat protein